MFDESGELARWVAVLGSRIGKLGSGRGSSHIATHTATTYLEHPPVYPELPSRNILAGLGIGLSGFPTFTLPGLAGDGVAQEYA